MQTFSLIFVAVVLLVFCVVDLYHLKQMLKTMISMENHLGNIEQWNKMGFKKRKKK